MKYILFNTSGLTHPPTLSLSLSLSPPPTGEAALRRPMRLVSSRPTAGPPPQVVPLRPRQRITEPLPIIGAAARRPPPPGSAPRRTTALPPPPPAGMLKAR